MTNDHKYSLTRVCLRMGQMSLSQAMLELFPEEGVITALDTDKGNEFDVRMEGRRTVTGLQDFYRSHHLAVNDQVLIRKLDDGRFALTPLPRPKRAEAQRDMPADRLVDRLLEMGSPLSEPEIRAAFPNLPRDLDLPALLGRDGRLVKKEGRWRKVNRQTSEDPAHHQNAGEHLELPERAGVPPHANRADQAGPGSPPRRATVTPYPRGVMFPGSAGLNSAQEPTEDPALQVRVRDALQAFGFRAEGLSHGQLIARADMGRRQYSVLVHPHAQEGRLDWAALLQRRRQTGASYLAVFGTHRDLLRLHSPAGLAQATLWSWEALARVQDLVKTVPIGPFDLEPHFQQGGLFEEGLERLEKTVSRRIAERGHFSAVLSWLATLRAPAVFVLDDILVDGDLTREQALKVLDLLGQAPFHLVARVDNGEFCLRYGVSQALLHLSEYALSLRDRFPTRRTERLTGSQEAAELTTGTPGAGKPGGRGDPTR